MKAKTLFILIVGLALIGFTGSAVAGWGGWGHHRGPGWHHRGDFADDGYSGRGGYGRGGYGYGADLSEEQVAKLEEERSAFFEATEPIRRDLYDKRLELNRVLDAENPDRSAAETLQKEISGLRAQLDQKRLDHRLAMQEISPELDRGPGRGYGKGYGRGPGMGYGRGPGSGGPGGGPCWY